MSGPGGGPGEQERAELVARNLDAVRLRISRAAAAAGRAPDDVSLIVVTKTYPASDVQLLAGLRVEDIGENRLAELLAKGPVARAGGMRVHAVGRIQSNKAGRLARSADVVHSVDRVGLVAPMGRARIQAELGPLPVLVQVSLDGDPQRGGAPVAAVEEVARAINSADGLRLQGLMAVAPLGMDANEAFAGLRGAIDLVRGVRPEADWVSAGMSGDLEAAIGSGATHVRVGAAVLGSRPPVR